MKILMFFIDGFGLGKKVETNPFTYAQTPVLDQILGQGLYQESGIIKAEKGIVIPTDACLGVPGIPQSATGQTTLWTGINASQVIGDHLNGFPNDELQRIIKKHSLLKQVVDRGLTATFANAFRPSFFAEENRPKSASTLVTLAAGLRLRNLEDLVQGQAVYQDITNHLLLERGYQVEPVQPVEAGRRLAGLAQKYDLTLFEYFHSDAVGHKQNLCQAIRVIEVIDAFIGGILERISLDEHLILVTSDHGNIEDLTTSLHTTNPVPTILIHNKVNELPYGRIRSLTDITPFILEVLDIANNNERRG